MTRCEYGQTHPVNMSRRHKKPGERGRSRSRLNHEGGAARGEQVVEGARAPSDAQDDASRGVIGFLSAPVDNASLVFFRIALGAIILWEVLQSALRGAIGNLYVKPVVYFTYFGFEWVRPWPAELMYLHFALVAALAACVMLGLWYRVTSVLFFLAWAYVFLVQRLALDSSYYLYTMFCLLMIFAPAHRTLSIDVARQPRLRSDVTPRWVLWLLRLQVGVVYFFGGVCKLNADWLRGAPMRQVLPDHTDLPLIGRWLAEEWMVYAFSYGGLFLDLLIVPLLLWRPTRRYAFALGVLFHLANSRFWLLGIFPWMMIAATTLFLSPDWPRRIVRFVKGTNRGRLAIPEPAVPANWATLRPWQTALIAAYVAAQILLPFQPFLYAGNVNWTGEGERFSWQLRGKAKAAHATFYLTDPVRGQTTQVRLADHLLPWQIHRMSFQPDMLLQFADYLHQHTLEEEGVDVEVRVHSKTSLNARKPQLLIDPTVNLVAVPRTLRSADWIMPLTEPLPSAEAQRTSKYMDDFRKMTIVFATGPSVTDDQLETNLPRLLKDPDLEALHLCHTRITDAGLAYVGQLKQLAILDLSDTNVTDEGLNYLRPLERLLVLNLSETKVTDAGVDALHKAWPGLRITR